MTCISAGIQAWKDRSANEWVHLFIHTLDTTPRNWYIEMQLRRGTEKLSLLTKSLFLTFSFESEYPQVEDALGVIEMYLCDDYPSPPTSQLDWVAHMENVMECYNFAIEEDDDPRNVNIQESEGSRDVHGPVIDIPEVTEKVKIKKVNIGTDANPKMVSIGHYWDNKTVGHIVDLLQKY